MEAQRVRNRGKVDGRTIKGLKHQAKGYDFVLRGLGSHWRTLSRGGAGSGSGRPPKAGRVQTGRKRLGDQEIGTRVQVGEDEA